MRRVPFLAAASAAVFLIGCSDNGTGLGVFVIGGPKRYPMGDKVEVGHVTYRVLETQWMTQIPQDPTPRIPQNRFLLVRVSAANGGGGDASVPGLTLVADDGKTYSELSAGEGVPQWIGMLRKVKPADSLQGNVVFDAPPRHYNLRVTDENSDTAALIDLPLNLTPEAPPQIPIPEAKK